MEASRILQNAYFELPSEWDKLTQVYNALTGEIIGQDTQLAQLAEIVALWDQSDAQEDDVTSILLLGPSGVGKTQTVKAISQLAHGRKDAFIRIDCGSLNQSHMTSSLLGSPNGYVGSNQKGMFEQNADYLASSKSILLFDEIEKADYSIFKMLLSIMDDKTVQCINPPQQTVRFHNTLIFFTSNIGSHEVSKYVSGRGMGFGQARAGSVDIKKIALSEFRKDAKFTPEWRGRLTKVIPYDLLSPQSIASIIDKQEAALFEYYGAKHGVYVDLSDQVKFYLLEHATDPKYADMGVRTVRDALKIRVRNRLDIAIAGGHLTHGDSVRAFLKDGEIVLGKAA